MSVRVQVPPGAHKNVLCGSSSFGRARPCQGRGGRFEPGLPLQVNPTKVGFFLHYTFDMLVLQRDFNIEAIVKVKPPSNRAFCKNKNARTISISSFSVIKLDLWLSNV